MKNKILLMAALATATIGVNVNALTYITNDFDTTGLTVNSTFDNNAGSGESLSFAGMQFEVLKPDNNESHDTSYYIKFADSSDTNFTENLVDDTNSGCIPTTYSSKTITTLADSEESNKMYRYLDLNELSDFNVYGYRYMLSKYDSVVLVRRDYNTTEKKYYCKVSNPIKINETKKLGLGQRYQLFLFGNNSTTNGQTEFRIFPYYPYIGGVYEWINYNVKVGKIEDVSIIKNMANNVAGAQQDLMNYAQKATNGTFYEFNKGNDYKNDLSNFAVTNGAFYYIYVDHTQVEGIIRDMKDIYIVQGKSGMLVTETDYSDYINKEVKGVEEVKKNPKTGIVSYTLQIVLGVTLLGITYQVVKRKELFKKI